MPVLIIWRKMGAQVFSNPPIFTRLMNAGSRVQSDWRLDITPKTGPPLIMKSVKQMSWVLPQVRVNGQLIDWQVGKWWWAQH